MRGGVRVVGTLDSASAAVRYLYPVRLYVAGISYVTQSGGLLARFLERTTFRHMKRGKSTLTGGPVRVLLPLMACFTRPYLKHVLGCISP